MRERDWLAPWPANGRLIERRDFAVDAVSGLGQALVSGNVQAARAGLAPAAPWLGLAAHAVAPPYALRIARDQALIVTAAPLALDEGWRGAFALTRMDDSYAVLDLSGAGAAEAVAEAVSADLRANSPSAACLFGGVRALLVARPDGFRLHVEASWRETVLARLAQD